MERNTGMLPVILLALLAGGAAYPRLTDLSGRAERLTPASPSASSSTTTGSSADDHQPTSVLDLLREHFGIEVAETDQRQADESENPSDVSRVRTAAARQGVAVRFLVATVPDPIDSYSGWQFDPIVDAIQQAATDSGYSLDRFFIPDIDALADTDDRTSSTRRRLHERWPGVILFRDTGDKYLSDRTPRRELLVVLLIAETPTFGIHQTAFDRAIRFITEWDAGAGAISVLGPTFSGSSASIATAFRNLSGGVLGTRPIRVVTGSATRSGRTGDGHSVNGNKEILEQSLPGQVSFKATVQPDDVTFWTLYDYVVQMNPRRDNRMAVLVETNTDYGHQIESIGPLIKQLPFPMHISRLAVDSGAPRATQAPGNGSPRFRSFSLSGLVNPTDRLPAPSFKTTASYLELVLANILDTIRRENIAAVGIMATDSRDKLFLAQQIATNCPNVTLFTIESDLLFAHPDYAAYMSRAIVASTYPLYNGNQLWSSPFGGTYRRLQFSTSAAQGIYNAALALLDYQEDGRPAILDPPPLLEYAAPGDRCARCWPAVWLSVVSQGTIWPIRVFAQKADDYLFHPRSDGTLTPPEVRTFPSTGTKILFALLTAVVVLHLAGCLVIAVSRNRRRTGRLVRWMHHFHGPSAAAHRRYLLACVLSLAAGYGFVLMLIGMWVASESAVPIGVLAMTGAVIAGLGICVAWLGWTGLVVPLVEWRHRTIGACASSTTIERRRSSASAAAALVGCAAVALCTWGSWSLLQYVSAPIDSANAMLLVERATDLGNRVSPIVPVLLLAAAVYLWGAVELARLSRPRPAFTDRSTELMSIVDRCTTGGTEDLKSGLRSLDGSILRLPVAGLPVVAIAGALIACFAFDPIVNPLVTIEGVAFNRFVTSFVLLVYFTIALALIQFVYRWHLLQEILKRLAWHPMVDAYARVPRTLVPRSLFPRQPQLVELQAPLGHWRTLALAGAVQVKDANTSIEEMAFDFQTDLEERRALLDSRTWHSLTSAATSVAHDLGGAWRGRLSGNRRVTGLERVAAAEGVEASRRTAAVADQEGAESERLTDVREEFVAMPVVFAIRDALARIGQNVAFIMGAILLVLASHLLYPFQAQQRLMAFIWTDILVAVAAVLAVIVQIERDAIMSRLTSTTPGQIAWDSGFVSKLLVYGVVPLLALFAAQFPGIGSTVLQWIEPVQRAIP